MTNSINPAVAQSTSFCGCAVLGNKAKDYFVERMNKEGYQAVEEFGKFCDNLTKWGYVKLEKTPDKDVFKLVGKDDYYSTKIGLDTTLSEFKAKLNFLKENNAIIDQK